MKSNISKFVSLTSQNTALLVIDMQADFYAPDGKAVKHGKQVGDMQKIAPLIDEFTGNMPREILVVMTKYVTGLGITPKNLKTAIKKEGFDFPCVKKNEVFEMY